jgi:hypothetical protein
MKDKKKINSLIQSIVGFIDGLNLGFIYSSFLIPLFHQFMMEVGKYIFFPMCVLAQIILSVLNWHQCYLDGMKPRAMVTAMVNSIAAVALTIAVCGGLFALSVFAIVTPIMFAATTIANTLFHMGSMIYYLVKLYNEKDPIIRSEYKSMVKAEVIASVVGVIATGAVVGVLLLGKLFLAPLGILVGVFVVTASVIQGISAYRQSKKCSFDPPALGTSAKIASLCGSTYRKEKKVENALTNNNVNSASLQSINRNGLFSNTATINLDEKDNSEIIQGGLNSSLQMTASRFQ